eukprot:CAMPEP_0183386780 /NCGR_PEP_ID=MMETSP0370-20130417/2677_1 /TAXON_ID=268820 /ORGANISM="Peridinium aciculiferum, Strain PAER-2" /LENGTH=56 /DNA_ID=CAMNT_0025565197 /DNA_START=100 /DNA_END=267 /DNA_ORIENTATION=+
MTSLTVQSTLMMRVPRPVMFQNTDGPKPVQSDSNRAELALGGKIAVKAGYRRTTCL